MKPFRSAPMFLAATACSMALLSGCMEMPDEYTAERDRQVAALRKKNFAEARTYARRAVDAAAHAKGTRGCYEQIEARNALYFLEAMNAEISSCLSNAQEGVRIYDAFTEEKDLRIHLVGIAAMNNVGNTLNYLGRFTEATNHLLRSYQLLADIRPKAARNATMLPAFWELDAKVRRNLSFSAMSLGQTNAASSYADEAIRAAAASSIKQYSLTARRQLALLTAASGNTNDAAKALNADADGSAFVRFMRSDQDKELLLYNTISRSLVAFRCADYPTAASTMQDAMKMPAFRELEEQVGPAAMWSYHGIVGLALQRAGHAEAAAHSLAKAGALLGQVQVPADCRDTFLTQGGDGFLHPADVLKALGNQKATEE